VEVSPISLRDTTEIERRIATFARSPNSGLILTAGALGAFNRNLIIALAAKHKLPSVYPTRLFAAMAA
jgi:putative ABC transport system substrate-binding protein